MAGLICLATIVEREEEEGEGTVPTAKEEGIGGKKEEEEDCKRNASDPEEAEGTEASSWRRDILRVGGDFALRVLFWN